ncbi:hypothetical protein HHI36_007325 [Cryptolaemus montrouzieri]|uniref:Uncharacterized protein n=1 Tax=Cryptolaemus montrouzieri TaxID=559131 RepID=A0ABD2MPC4_9CUCU
MTGREKGHGESPKRPPDSPKSPDSKKLRESIKFFEKVWTGTRSSTGAATAVSAEDVEDFERRLEEEKNRNVRHTELGEVQLRQTPSSSPRHIRHHQEIRDDGTIEETITTTQEEGNVETGTKTIKFEKVIVRKTVQQIPSPSKVPEYHILRKTPSRTPSVERLLEDSAYVTRSNGNAGNTSRDSSLTSFGDKFSSEENLDRSLDVSRSGNDDWDNTSCSGSKVTSSSSEWYSEYRTQSFHSGSSKLEYVRSKSQFDQHIASIREFLTKKGIQRIPYPLYSFNVVSGDFFLFSKKAYDGVEEIKEALIVVL